MCMYIYIYICIYTHICDSDMGRVICGHGKRDTNHHFHMFIRA